MTATPTCTAPIAQGTIFGSDVDGVRIGVARGIRTALVAKVFGRSKIASVADLAEAVMWADSNGAHIISLSLSYRILDKVESRFTEDKRPLRQAVSEGLENYLSTLRLFESVYDLCQSWVPRGHSAGCLFVAAAGNESTRRRPR